MIALFMDGLGKQGEILMGNENFVPGKTFPACWIWILVRGGRTRKVLERFLLLGKKGGLCSSLWLTPYSQCHQTRLCKLQGMYYLEGFVHGEVRGILQRNLGVNQTE